MRPRRIAMALALLLVAATAAHGALWWWVTAEIERQVAATLANPGPGWQASAGTLRRTGWPWAATVELPAPTATHLATPPVRWQADRLAVSLALTRPRTLVFAVAGPQSLRIGPAAPVPFTAARMQAALPLGPDPAARNLAVEVADLQADLPQGRLALARLDLTARWTRTATADAPALALAATASGIALPPGQPWPLGPAIARLALDLDLSGPVPRQPDLAAAAEAWREAGGTLALRRLEIAWGDVALSATATLALDAALQPAGTAQARLSGHEAAVRALTVAGFIAPRAAIVATAVLTPMARIPPEGGPPAVEMPFALRDRTLSMGPIPLLRVPELVWRPPA